MLAERRLTTHSFLPVAARNRFQSVLRSFDHVQSRNRARFSSERTPAVPKQSKNPKIAKGLRYILPRGPSGSAAERTCQTFLLRSLVRSRFLPCIDCLLFAACLQLSLTKQLSSPVAIFCLGNRSIVYGACTLQ